MKAPNPLLRFLAGHLAVGVTVGWSVLGALIALDVGSLGTLIARSREPVLVVGVTAVLFAITFGSLAMGAGVMSLRADGPRGGRRFRLPRLSSRAPLAQTSSSRSRN
jgi:hypothetical protein